MISRRIGSTVFGGLWGLRFVVLTLALLQVMGAGRQLAAADRPRPGTGKSKSEGRAAFIDRLLESSWKKAGVNPAKPATDEEYSRRAYLDLLGRIPNVQEARAFLQTKEIDKREKLVDFLLEHADYPKNFATQWTILLIGRGNQGEQVRHGEVGYGAVRGESVDAHSGSQGPTGGTRQAGHRDGSLCDRDPGIHGQDRIGQL